VPARLSETTAEELQAVAAKVFRRGNMTIGVLRAPPEDEAT
jgi:predicted Zn-dependent peptidase